MKWENMRVTVSSYEPVQNPEESFKISKREILISGHSEQFIFLRFRFSERNMEMDTQQDAK